MLNLQYSKRRPAIGEAVAHLSANGHTRMAKILRLNVISFSDMFKKKLRALFPCMCQVRVVTIAICWLHSCI